MKLSICLFRESVISFDELVQNKFLEGVGSFELIEASIALPYPSAAYVQSNRGKKPNWISYVASHFDLSTYGLLNQNSSFILLLKAADRFFAVTFGMAGMHAIDPAKIEPRFGLIVAANCIKDHELCTVESNEVDTSTRHKQIHISKGSNVSEFDLNPHVDWIRRLSGVLHGSDVAKSLTGSDSVSIGANCGLRDLATKCEKLLSIYKLSDYKTQFEIIDHLQPLQKHDPVVPFLEEQLSDRLKTRSTERISLAFPEVPNPELLEHYKVTGAFHSEDFDELTLSGIYDFMDRHSVQPKSDKVHIIGIGANDTACTRLLSLREYLVGEFEQGLDTFLFCHGNWFRADRNYVARIRQLVASLPDVTTELALVPIRNKESEGDYNIRAANVGGLLLMDKANFKIGGPYDKIEICDLLTDRAKMICVKKMDDSSSMSHLFAQGSVSATLLRQEPTYLTRLNKVASDAWETFTQITSDNLGRVTIVFAVATRKTVPLAEGMFFFSLVNLLNHVKTIRMVGCDVALCQIGYEGPPAAPTPTKRKTKKVAVGSV